MEQNYYHEFSIWRIWATLRVNAGLTVEQVAHELGIDRATLSRFENSGKNIRSDLLPTLLELYDRHIEEYQGLELLFHANKRQNIKRREYCLDDYRISAICGRRAYPDLNRFINEKITRSDSPAILIDKLGYIYWYNQAWLWLFNLDSSRLRNPIYWNLMTALFDRDSNLSLLRTNVNHVANRALICVFFYRVICDLRTSQGIALEKQLVKMPNFRKLWRSVLESDSQMANLNVIQNIAFVVENYGAKSFSVSMEFGETHIERTVQGHDLEFQIVRLNAVHKETQLLWSTANQSLFPKLWSIDLAGFRSHEMWHSRMDD